MNTLFQNQVVLITGAGRGVGKALAQTLAKLGAKLALNDISPVNVEQVAAEIGPTARVYVHDMAKKVAVQAMINDIGEVEGRIDWLFHCARVDPTEGLLGMDEWDMHRVVEVNLVGAGLVLQSVGRVMRAQGGGTIVLTAKPATGPSGALAQSTGAAVLALAQSAAQELATDHIRLFGLRAGPSGYNQIENILFRLAAGEFSPGGLIELEGHDG